MEYPKKYVGNVKICGIKFNCSNANAAVHGDYYFLRICMVRNKICIYIKIQALLLPRMTCHI
jgi:hypothetical protein